MQSKFNLTAYNIFKIIKYILMKRKFFVSEIVSYLDSENIYLEQETVCKYIRTLKKIGFEFEKTSAKEYKMVCMPFDFPEESKNFLEELILLLKQSSLRSREELCEKLMLFLPIKMQKNLKQSKNNISKMEKFMKDGLRLKLVFNPPNPRKETVFELCNIVSDGQEKYLQGYDVNKREPAQFNMEDIAAIEQLPIKNKISCKRNEATLKFSAKIAKSYILREEDELIEKADDKLLIKTFFYDKTEFYKRILRYVDNCEIISPMSLKAEYNEFLTELYQMYDCANVK